MKFICRFSDKKEELDIDMDQLILEALIKEYEELVNNNKSGHKSDDENPTQQDERR